MSYNQDNKVRIAYVVAHIGATGVNRVVLELVLLMKLNGHNCDVFFLKTAGKAMPFPCDTIRLTNWNELADYDIIHAHGLKPEIWLLKNRWKFRKILCRTKFVTTLHCYCFQDFFDLYGKVKGAAMGVAYLLTKKVFDRVVCLSKDMMQYYERWIPKRKLTYVYNTRSIDTAQLTVSDEEQEMLMRCKGDGVLIGMNCVLLYRKGIDVMLKAMALLPDRFRLMIVGDGKEKDTFQQMAQELGVEQRVCFAGRRNEACRYLPYYDIYAMPSRSEGFPLVLLESAACGTKVVASNLPVVKECFTDDEVVTFDMPDAQALANAIIKADEMEQLGENLKKRFELDYAPEVFYRRYMEIYGDGETTPN